MSKIQQLSALELQRHASIRSDIHRALDLQALQKACDRMRTLGWSTDEATRTREKIARIKQELQDINNQLHHMEIKT